MSSRHQPLNGADSMPIDSMDIGCRYCMGTYTAGETHECERPFRAFCEDYDGDRYWLTVTAIGPKGATVTARQTAIDRGHDVAAVLSVELAA